MNRFLITLGIVLVVLGLLWPVIARRTVEIGRRRVAAPEPPHPIL